MVHAMHSTTIPYSCTGTGIIGHNWAYFDCAPGSSRATNPKRAVHRKKAIFHDFAWETPDFEIAAGS